MKRLTPLFILLDIDTDNYEIKFDTHKHFMWVLTQIFNVYYAVILLGYINTYNHNNNN